MEDRQKELSTIVTEQNFMRVGDPMIVNEHDDHDLHIEEHTKELNTLDNSEQTMFKQNYINILKSHIELHKQYKERIK